MTTIDFNRALQDAKSASFEALPIGDYNVEINEATATRSSNGKPMIKVKCRVLDGVYANRQVFNNFVLSLENPQAMAIFFRHMKCFGLHDTFFASLGQTANLDAVASALKNQRARLTLGIRQWNGEDRNDVQQVKPYTGAPGPQGGPAAGPSPNAGPVAGPGTPGAVPLGGPQPGPQPAPPAAPVPPSAPTIVQPIQQPAAPQVTYQAPTQVVAPPAQPAPVAIPPQQPVQAPTPPPAPVVEAAPYDDTAGPSATVNSGTWDQSPVVAPIPPTFEHPMAPAHQQAAAPELPI